ncbi:CheR family methyltransferase [Aquabacterium sp.]|uniref:CheR family methyltransferase n=1 Tax=Aquabacterium sp. TaxID=1872578 RepID=UPI003D6D8C40
MNDDQPGHFSNGSPSDSVDSARPGELLPADHAEQDLASTLDNVVPSRGFKLQPIVGLGGSAGSITALQAFFEAMPSDSGMVFVVILHLSPDHESRLASLLQRATSMRVMEVTGPQKVEPNCVYVIPPGKALSAADGYLRLSDLVHERGKRVAVDLFFRTLAETHGPHASAIVLSGADGDGAIGIKRIKERGGLTVAQDPYEAEHQGMPRAAIDTGMVDWVLSAKDMPARLINYQRMEGEVRLPAEDGPKPVDPPNRNQEDKEAALRDVLTFLRTRTGRDFSYYKRATVLRRLGRRMQVNGVDDLVAYLALLRANPGESGALLQDLLISVTNFFRDSDCFAALEAVIPELFKDKAHGDAVRIWVAACATGEEAYSIAMLLHEYARKLDAPPLLQIFATDLDGEAINVARNGVYPETIAADVSEERLNRFFTKEHRGYRVRREIRETVLFAVHDLLKDSPFSRLDMVSCRNLLIYLNREAQARALEIFHFALQPGGRMFLGSSESVDEGSPLFTVLDKKHRLFTHWPAPRTNLPMPFRPGTLALNLEVQLASKDVPVIAGKAFDHARPLIRSLTEPSSTRPVSWGELHFKLIERLAPPSLIVNAEHDIVHLSETAGRFLQYSGGELTKNLLRAVHPALRIELRAALYRAAQTGGLAESGPVPVDIGSEQSQITLRVAPAGEAAPDFFLVVFDAKPLSASEAPQLPHAQSEPEPDPLARQLDRELERLKLYLSDTVEQYEASNEELKSSNEELQAMNEELRSATEELETSREELQSINEELSTVNLELKSKVDELGHANSDLHNLMGATAIATIFLDRQLRITRYTPPAVALFNLIPSDIGRPLTDLTTQLDYAQLGADETAVLEQLVPVEREVSQSDGTYFLARLLPYRTIEDHIAGVVLTFVDITERKRNEEALRLARDELEDRVRARTADLAQANASLRSEVQERITAEQRVRDLLGRLVGAQEDERRRISRELHDTLGQHMALLGIGLKAIMDHAECSPEVRDQLTRSQAALLRLEDALDRLSHELRPTSLDDLGLQDALRRHLEGWSADTNIKVDFQTRGVGRERLPEALETTAYRVVQEALTNVHKHAGATRVGLIIERRHNDLRIIVEDNGKGFERTAALEGEQRRGMGLRSMTERALMVAGQIEIESGQGQGTTVYLTLPMSAGQGDRHG